MGTDRFGLRAILSVTLAAGPLLAVFPLPASASGPPSLISPTFLYGSGPVGPTTVGPATVGPATVGPASGQNAITQGEIAAQFALSQLGKPYVYGAAGPYGYDCSGLALASWRAAGVELPRTAADQYYAGSHVPVADVRPGDLLFWASDVSDPATIYHVAISLGGYRAVQATETGQPVEVMPLWPTGLLPLATRP